MRCKNQNECNMGNDCFRKLPNAENCTCGWTNPVWVKELEKKNKELEKYLKTSQALVSHCSSEMEELEEKLAIAKEALIHVQDYGYTMGDEDARDIYEKLTETLKQLNE